MALSSYTTTGGQLIDGVLMLNGTIDINGSAGIKFDADGDSSIDGSIDNTLNIKIGGASDFTVTSNSLNVLTGSCIAGPSSMFVPFVPLAAGQAISGTNAINVTSFYTAVTSTAANTGTLSDGVIKGQLKKIRMVVDAGDFVITPSNASGFSTITLNDVGDEVLLIFDGTVWRCIENYGAALA